MTDVPEEKTVFGNWITSLTLVYCATVNFYILYTSKLSMVAIQAVVASGKISTAEDFRIVIKALGLTETDAGVIGLHVGLAGFVVGAWVLGIDFASLLLRLKGKK